MALLSRTVARAGWILVGCGAAIGRPGAAQSREHEYDVKAAYLFNFLNYVEWPPSAGASGSRTISLCVLGADPFGETLRRTIGERTVSGGRRVLWSVVARPVEASDCDVGFIPADANPAPTVWLEALESRPVFTVGELPDFAAQGGIIAFVIENQTVRFDVNLAAARAAGFQISSRLLRLARTVRE